MQYVSREGYWRNLSEERAEEIDRLRATIDSLQARAQRLRARVAELEAKLAEAERGREDWKGAALQACKDLEDIESEFREGRAPIGPGYQFAEWTSPANTMRWIRKKERGDD